MFYLNFICYITIPGNKSVVKQINGLFSVESKINFFVFFGILQRTILSGTGILSIASNNVNL